MIPIDETLVNKRVLFTQGYGNLREGVVDELSPSGKYISINSQWYGVETLTIIEILKYEEGE